MLGNGPSVANQNKSVPNILPDPSSSWWKDHQTFLQGQSPCHLVRCSKMYWSPRGSHQSMNYNIRIDLNTIIIVNILIFNKKRFFCLLHLPLVGERFVRIQKWHKGQKMPRKGMQSSKMPGTQQNLVSCSRLESPSLSLTSVCGSVASKKMEIDITKVGLKFHQHLLWDDVHLT